MEEQHEVLTRLTKENLKTAANKLRNGTSSHTLDSPVSLSQVQAFLTASSACKGLVASSKRFHIGSVGGSLVLSSRLRPSAPVSTGTKTSTKKRGYDDSEDRAKAVLEAARTRLNNNKNDKIDVTDELLQRAEETITRLFRDLRGAAGEVVVEALGLSVSTHGAAAAEKQSPASVKALPTPPTRPKLILAARLAAGVAIPLDVLRRALMPGKEGSECDDKFPDGMLSVSPENLAPEYRLPISTLTKTVEAEGQKPILLFSSVGV